VINAGVAAAGDLISAIVGRISSGASALRGALLGPIESAVAAIKSTIDGLWNTFNSLKNTVSNFRIPSFSAPAPAPTGDGTQSFEGTRRAAPFALDGGPVIYITIDARGASDDIEGKIERGVSRALRTINARTEARIRTA